jgi:hypothetical protein
MLGWTFQSRVTRVTQGVRTQSFADLGVHDHANASRPDPEAARDEVAQVLAGIRAPMSHTVQRLTVADRILMKSTRRRYPASSTRQSRRRCRKEIRSMLSGGWAILMYILNGGACT